MKNTIKIIISIRQFVLKLSVLLAISLLMLIPAGVTKAAAGIIYQTSAIENITSGATLEKITRFTTDGWLQINVLRIDLSNPYIKVDTLTSAGTIKKTASTKNLAQSRGAVAAINGGFFNWITDGAYPDGPLVESGTIKTASNEYNRYNDSMATFSLNNLNQVLINYWKTDLTLKAPNGALTVVRQYNKPSADFTDYTILDRKWSDNSIGASAAYPDITEMIVDNGKVVEIRTSKPATAIPANGYTVVTRQNGAAFLE